MQPPSKVKKRLGRVASKPRPFSPATLWREEASLPPSNVRCALCLPFASLCFATKGPSPLEPPLCFANQVADGDGQLVFHPARLGFRPDAPGAGFPLWRPYRSRLTEGGVDEAGVFHMIPRIDDLRLAEIFAGEVLADLVRKELLSPEWADRLLSWRHTGFNVHSRVRA